MADTKWLKDENNVKFFPRTHINSVKDDDGNTVGALLGGKADKSDTYTKAEVNNLIPSIQQDIVVGALPTTGSPNTIYRVPGTTSYTDWAWDGTQWVELATYNNAIDDVPTQGSNNLVKSGGVWEIQEKIFESPDISILPISTQLSFSNVNKNATTIDYGTDGQGNPTYIITWVDSSKIAWVQATPPNFIIGKKYGVHFKVVGILGNGNVECCIKGSTSFNMSPFDVYVTEDKDFYAEFIADRDYRNLSFIIRGLDILNETITISELYINEIVDANSLEKEIENINENLNTAIVNECVVEINYAQSISQNIDYLLVAGETYYYEVEYPNIIKTCDISYGLIGHIITIDSCSYANGMSGDFVAQGNFNRVTVSATLIKKDVSEQKLKVRIYQKVTLEGLTQKHLLGKTINFLGDSITSTDYTVPTWWQYLSQKLGFTGVPYAQSGTCIANTDISPDAPFVERYVNMADADAVVVMGGTNDASSSTNRGIPLIGSVDSEDKNTLRGALNIMIKGLLEKYPGKPILFITPPQRAKTYETYTGYTDLSQMSDTDRMNLPQVVEVIKQSCRRYSIPCLDVFNESGINGCDSDEYPWVYYRSEDSDGHDVHPSELGQKKLAKVIERFLLDNI